MRKREKAVHTYIQGNLSPAHQSHMDFLGFGSTTTPGKFEADAAYQKSSPNYIVACRDVLTPASQLPMHSHNYMEIFHYISENQVEYLIDSHRYIVKKGDIICVPPGVCHQVLRYKPQDIPCVRNLICIMPSAPEYIGPILQPNQYYLLRSSDITQKSLGKLCALCVEEYNKQELHWRDMLNGYTQILLTHILRNPALSIKAEPDGLFEQLLAHINSNLEQKITLADTARHFYTSERTITREFQKNLGISFYRYVTQRRLIAARNLIFNGIPLKEVCHRTGFGDYPTFFRAFKREYGMSPRQMKELDAFMNLG